MGRVKRKMRRIHEVGGRVGRKAHLSAGSLGPCPLIEAGLGQVEQEMVSKEPLVTRQIQSLACKGL